MLKALRRPGAPAALRHQGAELAGISRWLSSKEEAESSSSGTIDFGFQEVPVQEKETLVKQVFSSVAPSYDVMNDLMSVGLHRLWKDRLVESLAPFAGMRHLDVAGGTGDVAFRVHRAILDAERLRAAAAAAGPSFAAAPDDATASSAAPVPLQGGVTVCDINAAMLAEGERKAAAQGVGHGMSWVEGNAEALPFADASFDAYTIAFGIRNVTDRAAALAEAARVLRPGGRFLCLEFSKVTLPGLQQLYDLYSFSVIPEVGRLVAGDAESYRYLVESIRMFPGQEEFAGMLRAAGLGGVRYENLTGGVVAIHSGIKPWGRR